MGSRIDEVKEFNSKKEADIFIKEFNALNDEQEVPEWYMVAKANY